MSEDELRALIVARELGVLSEEEEARVARALAEDPGLARLSADASAALADPEPGPLCAPAGAWEGIAQRIAEVRAERLVADSLPILLRCTYCHDQVAREGAAYCASCLAPHHASCFREHGQCSAPGCSETQVVAPRLPGAEVARPQVPCGQRAWIAGAAGLGFVAAAALGWTFSGPPEPVGGAASPPPRVVAVEDAHAPPEVDPSELLRNAQRLLRSARDHVVLARVGEEQGARAEARIEVEQSLALLETADGRLLSGLLSLERGESAEAVRDLERAVALEPELEAAHEALGWLAIDRGEFERACAHYRRAIASGGAEPRASAGRGLARGLLALGRVEESRQVLAGLVERRPEDTRALLLLGEVDGLLRREVEARSRFDQVLRLDPAEVEAYLGRARVAQRLGDLEAALADATRALELDPARGDTWTLIGTLRDALGQRDAALAAALRAVELGPSAASSQRALERLLRGLGRPEAAAEVQGWLGFPTATARAREGAVTLLRGVELGGRARLVAGMFDPNDVEPGDPGEALEWAARALARRP
ncbi:MAG: tetratricopeptide repeat protein, partial [Planctomycetes bacterium]|nr:tetratricopeptide repeat protein [Planctomycetota bacterium]